MRQSYLKRFDDFSCDPNVENWRNEQQEWDRLTTMVCSVICSLSISSTSQYPRQLILLATMHAAILAIEPNPPPFARGIWLGGAGISVCCLFIVFYFPIKAFPIRDEDISALVQEENHFISVSLLSVAVASPVLMTLWASILFVTGIIDHLIQADLGGGIYRVIACIPLCFGFAAVVGTVVIGEILAWRIEVKVGFFLIISRQLTSESFPSPAPNFQYLALARWRLPT